MCSKAVYSDLLQTICVSFHRFLLHRTKCSLVMFTLQTDRISSWYFVQEKQQNVSHQIIVEHCTFKDFLVLCLEQTPQFGLITLISLVLLVVLNASIIILLGSSDVSTELSADVKVLTEDQLVKTDLIFLSKDDPHCKCNGRQC